MTSFQVPSLVAKETLNGCRKKNNREKGDLRIQHNASSQLVLIYLKKLTRRYSPALSFYLVNPCRPHHKLLRFKCSHLLQNRMGVRRAKRKEKLNKRKEERKKKRRYGL